MKKYTYGIIYTLLLVAFTAYLLLDTFVITRVYEVLPPESTAEQSQDNISEESSRPEQGPEISTTVSENSYKDENIQITLTEHRLEETTVYVADVLLSSPDYLKTAFANNSYGRNVKAKTSVTAANNNAILAVNGDFYGARERGVVYRNGVLYRSSYTNGRDCLVVTADGEFEIMTEEKITEEYLSEINAAQVFSFGPALVKSGIVTVGENDEVGQAMQSNPRTAIGIIEPGHYLFVVSDGRTDESEGLSLKQLGDFMRTLGAKTAYNLDGGGSSTMYFNGEIVNKPTTNGRIKERKVSDIVYIGY